MPERKQKVESRLIVPLDYDNEAQALAMADQLDPQLCRAKVGKELFTRCGPAIVSALHQRGFDVFLDLKFHDIPNTVAGAVRAAGDMGIWMVNVHASGGREMLLAAVEAARASNSQMLVTAVTVLTSLDQKNLSELGVNESTVDHVHRLAALSHECGLDGVVCSAHEVSSLSTKFDSQPSSPLNSQSSSEFCFVTPGIRPASSQADDQKRTMTPLEAIQQGSSYLVIGRPITQSAQPLQTVRSIIAEISHNIV